MLVGAFVLLSTALPVGREAIRFEASPASIATTHPYFARFATYALSLASNQALVVFRVGEGERLGSIGIRFVGGSSGARARARVELPGRSHYLLRDHPGSWRVGARAYGEIEFESLYPGIDVRYHGRRGALEMDFLVQPGADPDVIEIEILGAERITTGPDGSLTLVTQGGALRLERPEVSQDGPERTESVPARYLVTSKNRIRLDVPRHDPTRLLVIDPILSFSTYLGGTAGDAGRAVAIDPFGNLYVVGETFSPDFPVASGLDPSYGGGQDIFVAKYSPSGEELLWSTYVGGSSHDRGFAVAVDEYGNAVVTGRTGSRDFPIVHPIQSAHGGGDNDAVVFKLAASGTALLFSTYLGGASDDRGLGIALDPWGNVALTGVTRSADFPLRNSLQGSLLGAEDAFVTRLDGGGSSLLFSSFLGGTGTDNGRSIVAESAGTLSLTGDTSSTDLPIVGGLQPTPGGKFDAYVARIDPRAPAILYSTYLGGSEDDFGFSIARSLRGDLLVAGTTRSPNFPIENALQATPAGQMDGFLAKIGAADGALVYSTYIGGSGTDFLLGVASEPMGKAWVTGSTSSADFPLASAIDETMGGLFDAVLLRVSPSGSSLEFSTLVGGSGSELGFDRTGVAVDGRGVAVMTGITDSADFPTSGATQASPGGMTDAFVSQASPWPRIEVRLREEASATRLSISLSHAGPDARQVELRLWIETAAGSFALVPPPALVTIAPRAPGDVLSVLLPPSVRFPGATVGGRLLEPVGGAVVSESLCASVPCH